MSDRRRYPRVEADVICRPAGSELFHHRRNTRDVSLGGMRVYTDEGLEVGSRWDIEVILSDQSIVRCWAVVVWRSSLGAAAPARFDVGLKFTDMAPSDIQRLATVLAPPG